MRAIEIAEPGGPDVLRVVERPIPVRREGEVLVRVVAAGVNRPDVMQRMGKYPPPPGASDIPGLEIAGEVVEGSSARYGVGDRVCALVAGGGYAEYCAIPAEQCLPVPPGLSMRDAAAVPETFFTVWTNLFQRAGLKSGESVLVHGGASGIGTTAIQLARAFGATVFTTAGSRERCDRCVALGAARAIDYKTEDFVAVVINETGRRGVDVILDIIGGDYLPRNIDCLAMDGRLAQIGLLGGSKVAFDFRSVLQKRLTITGSTLRVRTPAEKGAIARELESRVWPLLAQGSVTPIVDAEFPLERAADAHRALEAGEIFGKAILVV
jgi:NADPH2:quinone reductase